ncbi:MAG: glycosyltransferase family 9 protein [Lentisphaeria bacterium]|nr:glycosyltransferase family 9 protein [Lentisphaeria bacterium]
MNKKEKILIFYSGSLGDQLIMVPVFGAIRNAHPDSEITLLNIHDSNNAFTPAKIIENTDLIDHLKIWSHKKVKILRKFRFLLFFCRPFLTRYKVIYYCGRDGALFAKRSQRDSAFLKAYSPGAIIRGTVKIHDFEDRKKMMPRISEIVLSRLNHDGLEPQLSEAKNELSLTAPEKAAAAKHFAEIKIPPGTIPLAVGPGGKKSVCRYPVEKYIEILQRLIKENNIFPVFFGGREDDSDITKMSAALGDGHSARADRLQCDLRTTIALLNHFPLYLGNDTGTLHMAAAAQVTCIIISSAHNNPGLWTPHGNMHIMLRSNPDCSGCREKNCPIATPPPCLLQISVDTVLEAVRTKLNELRESV